VVAGALKKQRAAAEALDSAERDLAVLGRLARPDAELPLESLQHRLRVDQAAADVRADLDRVLPDRLDVEHVVEARDRIAVGRRELERLGGFLESLTG